MVKIRLRRVGAKKQPSYRVVVADSRSPRDGRFIEAIGFYNPRTEPPTVEIKEERALYWLSQGAQPSQAVLGLFQGMGTIERLTRLKSGEALDVLLNEAATARESMAEAGPTSQDQEQAQPVAAAAQTDVAEDQAEAKEVVSQDSEVENTQETTELATESAEEEA
jgi:small subunit ribosomal protein S16